jgi:signal transduction histidine kinase
MVQEQEMKNDSNAPQLVRVQKYHPLHILIVEDEEAHAVLIRKAFANTAKYRLTTVLTLKDARGIITRDPPALALVDWLLPDGNGAELLPHNGMKPDFPIIIMTSHGNESLAVELMKAGALDYLVKTQGVFEETPHTVDRALREWEQILQQKKTEEALQVTNKKLNLLSSITRHDILNHLSGLRGYVELSKDLTTNPRLLAFIEKEEHEAEAIFRLIEFTRFYQNIGIKKPIWQNVAGVILEGSQTLDLKGIELELDPVSVKIFADPLLERVFYNLIENSIRHGEKVKKIQFHVKEGAQGLTITEEDDGAGVPPEKKEAIFTHQFFTHTGFGLFLSREILSITGITIEENGEPGTGARFVLHVPGGYYRILP